MKRKTSNVLCALLALVLAAGLLPTSATAAPENIPVDAAHFPDANFRTVVSAFDTDGDGALSAEEIADVWEISCAGKDISSLQGIAYFTALTDLVCSDNQLTALDLSHNPELDYLVCSNNQLTELDLRSNPKMSYLDCSENQLTLLDVSAHPALQILYCQYNHLKTLDVGASPYLMLLYCYENQLNALDVRNNGELEVLACEYNQLTELDVRSNPALEDLGCTDNELTALDVRSNPALTELHCSGNQLTSLDVSSNSALEKLDCDHNQLTELDVRSNPALTALRCGANALTTLDVRKNTALTDLSCIQTGLSALDVRSNTALIRLDCSLNRMTELDVRNNTALEYLACGGNFLTTLDISRNTALEELYCFWNNLTTLDVSNAPVLLDAVKNGVREVSGDTIRYLSNTEQGRLWTRIYMDKGVTILPEGADPNPIDPTPASPQPTTRPDGTKPAEPTTKPDDSKPVEPTTKPDDTKPIQNPFADVQNSDYFYDPVLWALTHEPQITNGMAENTFAPGETCTRGQVVTFLWRAMGCEEPKSANNPFSDVASGDYFYKAVLWAVEKGITDGTSDTTFSPNDPCTRAHVVTFLWRCEGKPAAGSKNPFADVAAGEYYTDAVLWAVSKGITDGTSDTTFSPADPCTRGQIVTFLYRDMQ